MTSRVGMAPPAWLEASLEKLKAHRKPVPATEDVEDEEEEPATPHKPSTHALGGRSPLAEAAASVTQVYFQQFAALYLKNALVAWRNWRATITRLLAPLILLILALCIDEALKAKDRNSVGFQEVRHPEVKRIGPIPQCREDMYMQEAKECEELAYSPDNAITREIMSNVVSRNEKNISARAFSTREDVQEFLFKRPDYMIGAVHFVFDGLSESSRQQLIDQFLPPAFNDSGNGFEDLFPPIAALPPAPDSLPLNFNGTLPPAPADVNLGDVIDLFQRRRLEQIDIPDDFFNQTGTNQTQFNETRLNSTLFDRFNQSGEPVLQGFIIQINTTIKNFKGQYQHPNNFIQIPLQNAVHREIARFHLKQKNETAAAESLEWNVGFKAFPSPPLSSDGVLSAILGPFVFAALMFSFVIQITTVVMEKELGLRQALRTMGMTDIAYWSSWGAWEVTLAFIQGHLVACFGLILQFHIFHQNNYGLLFFLFFLFQLAMSSMALLISAFLNRTQAAVYLGFTIFIVGWIMQAVVAFGVPYSSEYFMADTLGEFLTVIFSLFPWSLLVKGFGDLGEASEGDRPGLKWTERDIYCQDIDTKKSFEEANAFRRQNNLEYRYVDFDCHLSLHDLYVVLIILWVGFFAVAVYLDNIFKNEVGLRKSIFYPLLPSYWFPSVMSPKAALMQVLKEQGLGPEPEACYVKDEDVMAEESNARALLGHRTGQTEEEKNDLDFTGSADAWNAIEVYGLKKNYGGKKGCCGRSLVCGGAYDCCSCRAQKSFWPVKDSWFVIPNNQLFCLLGPNGAGKTTTINMLIGMLPPTHGDALVHGQSIRSSGGMNEIRSMMGVCPQFDILWPELTGKEHLQLYGRIKSSKWKWNSVATEADTLLEKVKLTYAADLRSGAYSGGMKRRLSVAIALLGDPKVVYLDEPTTGMDPISRRYVWDTIQEAKLGRAIILTTHSMEEADILGDRIAIMALGRLRAIGSSLRLKQRFGAGFQVSVSVQPNKDGMLSYSELDRRCGKVKHFFAEHLKLQPTDENRSYINYLVPREREDALVEFLQKLEGHTMSLGITDIQLSLASLEEVFLTIARGAAMEAAKSDGMQPQLKELPFWSTCAKASLLGLFLPITILAAPWWKRILVGKEDTVSTNSKVVLPNGTTVTVEPGQEQVEDHEGAKYDIIWSLDDEGHLRAQDVQPARPILSPPGPVSMFPDGGPPPSSAVPPVSSYKSADDDKVTVVLPDCIISGVEVGAMSVLHPATGQTLLLDWSRDGHVRKFTPLPTPQSQLHAQVAPPALRRKPNPPSDSQATSNSWEQDSVTGLPVARAIIQAPNPHATPNLPGSVPSLKRTDEHPTEAEAPPDSVSTPSPPRTSTDTDRSN